MPSLTAIVPATDRPSTLAQCVAAIETAAEAPEELMVIADGPPRGPAEARNRGAARASGDVLVFVDSDVLVHHDAFTRIRAAFDSDAGLDATFGSYDAESGSGEVVSAFRNLLLHDVHRTSPRAATTFWSGLGAVRREVFLAAGGFNAERYRRPSIEDIDLGLRLSGEGRRIELDFELQGTHLKRWTLPGMVRIDLLDRGLPWMRLMLAARELPPVMNLRWHHRASLAASLLVALGLVRRRPALVAPALAALLALNHGFYSLLAREHGLRTAGAGVALHVVHHLTAALAAVLALAEHLRGPAR